MAGLRSSWVHHVMTGLISKSVSLTFSPVCARCRFSLALTGPSVPRFSSPGLVYWEGMIERPLFAMQCHHSENQESAERAFEDALLYGMQYACDIIQIHLSWHVTLVNRAFVLGGRIEYSRGCRPGPKVMTTSLDGLISWKPTLSIIVQWGALNRLTSVHTLGLPHIATGIAMSTTHLLYLPHPVSLVVNMSTYYSNASGRISQGPGVALLSIARFCGLASSS